MFQEYKSKSELPHTYGKLLEEAISATASSYAPYSGFNVGAAVLMENGQVVTGSNQENSSYPSGLCAERVALFSAHHRYPDIPVIAIAIAAKCEGKVTPDPVYPCGACVQVMVESQKRGGQQIKVIMGSAGRIQSVDSVEELLPYSFSSIPE
ncbi:MAG: cytidine deaminase [Bacteroidales bacterium]|nr:cytidine deaminase [Bacteroidales bacterium]